MANEDQEGVIKYQINWKQEALAPGNDNLQDLISHRNQAHRQQWVGFDQQEQVGYGNISVRAKQNSGSAFYISGSQTGHIENAAPAHFALVNSFSIAENKVSCKGLVKASSESLTHAALYSYAPWINAVLHIHHAQAWNYGLRHWPSTDQSVPYGTPAMAAEIARLMENSNLKEDRILAMSGHQDGIIAFGRNIEEVMENMGMRLTEIPSGKN